MNDDKKAELMKEFEVMREQLQPYARYYTSCDRWGRWSVLMTAILVVQIGVMIYDMTLPVHQALFLPFFICWCLAWIGSQIPRHEMRAASKELEAREAQAHDDYYKVLTGVIGDE